MCFLAFPSPCIVTRPYLTWTVASPTTIRPVSLYIATTLMHTFTQCASS
jgi:hypothetical protein